MKALPVGRTAGSEGGVAQDSRRRCLRSAAAQGPRLERRTAPR
jgi:hypothetical protein